MAQVKISKRQQMELFKMCLQDMSSSFSVYQATFLIQKMCVQSRREAAFQFNKPLFSHEKRVFKTIGGLLFSLFSYFSNTKNVCSKQARGCFLVYYLLISIILLKCFYYEFYKNFRERCFLVCLANYIKLLWTAAFQFIH